MRDWILLTVRAVLVLTFSIIVIISIGAIIIAGGPDHAERLCLGLPTGDHVWIVDRGVIHRVPEWMQQRYYLEAQAPGPCPPAGSPKLEIP